MVTNGDDVERNALPLKPDGGTRTPVQDSPPPTDPNNNNYDKVMGTVLIPSKTPTGIHSEHGHSLMRIRPMSKHSGVAVVTFFNGLFQTVIAISTLGASITFSYVVSNNAQTPLLSAPRFNPAEVQLFLSISWLLFLLALAFSALGSTLLTFFKDHWTQDWEGLNGKTSQFSVQMYAVTASSIMGGTVIGAFVLLCLVVVAYSPVVGWIALGFTGFFGFIVVLAIANQVPWPWREDTPTKTPQRHTA